MKWKRVLAGTACVLTMGGGAAHAQKIINPDWASRPDGRQVAEAYPPLAVLLRIEGRSTLSCTVSSEGQLRNCVTQETTPTGLGFDGAALKLAESFRMTPKREDGRATSSGTVRIPVRFVLPEDTRRHTGAAPDIGAPTSPGAAALALQLAPLLSRDIIARQNAAAEIASDEAAGSIDEQTKAQAMRALSEATRAAAADWGKVLAGAYAAAMTESELQATLEFLSNPAGADLEARRIRVLLAQAPIQAQFETTTSALARDKFCAQTACGVDRWQPPEGVALVNPPWSRQPAEYDIQNRAPPIMSLLGLSGWAQINCVAQPSGRLDSCFVARESPKGLHFGAAALQLSDGYQIDSARAGKDIAGETVAILIDFKPTSFKSISFTQTTPALPVDQPQGKAPSEEAMGMARRIVQTDPNMQQVDRLASQLKILDSFPSSGGTELMGAKALVQAIQENRLALADQMARTYADVYTPAELGLILDFRLGPGGQAAQRLDFNRLEALERFHGAKAAADARRRFCANRDCEPAAAKAATS
jgi:TonB family protein